MPDPVLYGILEFIIKIAVCGLHRMVDIVINKQKFEGGPVRDITIILLLIYIGYLIKLKMPDIGNYGFVTGQ